MSVPTRILIVDDEPAVAEFLALTVRALGHEADVALDGRAAIDLAAETPPALAFVDALLPKVDGFQVLRELRAANPRLPVVMMSGIYKKRNFRDEAVDALGAKAYLHKPISVAQVWGFLDRFVGPAPGSAIPEGFPGPTFDEKPLPAVLGELARERRTGLLFVRGDGGTAVLYLEDGRIVFARSNDPASRLDRVLQAAGKLDDAGMASARRLAAEKGSSRLGDRLVEEGLIDRADLEAALTEQVRVHVTRPFRWENGATQFLASDAPKRETVKVGFDTLAIVAWGCRQLAVGPRLEAWLPRGEQRLQLNADSEAIVPRLELSEAELQLTNLLDGTRDTAKVRAIGRMMQVDIDRVLAMLLALGAIDVGDAPDVASPPAPTSLLVPAAGDLARTAPARVLTSIGLAQKTGTVEFERREKGREVRRVVHFSEGRVAFAASNHPRDRLGQVLVGRGLVDEKQLRDALDAARRDKSAALGRVLVDRGLLELDALHDALVAQVVQVLSGLLSWREGTFHFRESALPIREIVPLDLAPFGAVLDALRASPMSDIAPFLPERTTLLSRCEPVQELTGNVALTSLEDGVLLALDRPRAVHELLAELDADAQDVLRSLHGLLQVGLVEGHAAPKAAETRAAADDEAAQSAAAPRRAAPAVIEPPEEFEDFGDDDAVETSAGDGSGPVTGDEASFAGLTDDESGLGALRGDRQRATASPVTGDEASFAGLTDEESGLGGLTAEGLGGDDCFAPLGGALDGGFAEGLEHDPTSAAERESGPAMIDCELDGFANELEAALSSGASRSAAATATAATATAVAAPKAAELSAEERAGVLEFLSRLAFHLSMSSHPLPEEVLDALPPTLRRRFGL